jgi:hypothetical protein
MSRIPSLAHKSGNCIIDLSWRQPDPHAGNMVLDEAPRGVLVSEVSHGVAMVQ